MRGGIAVDAMSIHKRSFFSDEGDIGMREDAFYPTPQLGDNGSHTLAGLSKGSTVDIGLRRDTANIQTGASHLSILEDDDFRALLGSIFSGAVTARPRADDNEISCCH